MARSYRFLEHTGDVFLEASGDTLGDALASAGQALFAVMVDLRGVRIRAWVDVEVHSADAEGLMVEWLQELLYQWETTGLLFRRIEVTEATETTLRARCGGEPVDPARHRLKAQVKAVTYHQARVARAGRGWRIRAVLDL